MQIGSALEAQIEIMRDVFDYREYPTELVVNDNPLRIPFLADPRVLDAVQSHRPYRPPYLDIAFGVGCDRVSGEPQVVVYCQDEKFIRSGVMERIVEVARGEARVEFTGRATLQHRARRRPPMVGSSVGHGQVTAGTIGCFVQHRGAGGIGLLSNNHVLAATNAARIGDAILQPGRADGGDPKDCVIGQLRDFVQLHFGSEARNFCDAAWAEINPELGLPKGNALYKDGIEIGQLGSTPNLAVLPGDPVSKIGRTSTHTDGTIDAVGVNHINIALVSGGSEVIARFDDQIAIVGENDFSQPGDSGSVVFDREYAPVGLLFGGYARSAAGGMGRTFASPIAPVLELLDLRILAAQR